MKSYKLVLLDLDGTLYRGKEKINDAARFVQQLAKEGTEHVFVTNNSTKDAISVVDHLRRFDIPADPSQVVSTALATAQFIRSKQSKANVFVIGEDALHEAIKQAGHRILPIHSAVSECSFVVIGLDRQMTYEKLAHACLCVRAGATFISTNADKALPSERGLVPGNGSLTSVIATSTGVDPIFIGKPERFMFEMILERYDIDRQDVLMIGDNYETDIVGGMRAGIDTALVLTGYTTKQALAEQVNQPTYCWNTLADSPLLN